MDKRTIETVVEDRELEPLVNDIRDFIADRDFSIDIRSSEVVDWAEDIYNIRISTKKARELISRANAGQGGDQ
jgi:hypothetical protein